MSLTPITPPYFTADLPGVGGRIKASPEDFVVEELPAYEPAGSGDHVFLWVEKRGMSSEVMVRQIARGLGIAPAEIGVAGIKDRWAVTRQYLSVPASAAGDIPRLGSESFKVLSTARHPHKLRTGHLRGNRFTITVRDAGSGGIDGARRIAERIGQSEFANYYGSQRFGRDDGTLELGHALMSGQKNERAIARGRRRFLLRLALSAVQSELFNRALVDRLSDDSARRVLAGDVMQVSASGGCFVAEDVAEEQRRLDAGETAITGPMFGCKMRWAEHEPGQRERAILAAAQLGLDDLARFKKLTTGARRPYLVQPARLDVAELAGDLQIRFELPKGCYATVLLDEFLKVGDRGGGEES